jgi:hypothetical protein
VRKEAIPVLAFLARPNDPKGIAMPVLKRRYTKDNETSYLVRATAVEAIGILAEPGVPPQLINALGDISGQVRLSALQSLASRALRDQLAGQEKIALDRLKKYLAEEKDATLRMWTHAAIMTINKKVDKANIDAIKQYIHASELPVQLTCLQLLSLGGPDAKPHAIKEVRGLVEAAMREKAKDTEITVGIQAIQTLVAMKAYECRSLLKAITDDKNSHDNLHNASVAAQYGLDLMEKADKAAKEKKGDDKK